MADSYFSKFPVVKYNSANAINLMARTKVLDRVYNSPLYYYTLEVPEFVRPDQLSNELYRDPYMAWLFYLANDVVDPYYQWNMDSYTFDSFIVEKYGSVQSAQGRVAYWQNNWFDDSTLLSVSQYDALLDTYKKYYEPVMAEKRILNYRRSQHDWQVNTNQIWEYSTDGDAQLAIDEKVSIGYMSNVSVANAQVISANSSVVRVQHVYGTANTANSITGSVSGVTVNVLSVKELATNIPLSEQVYWSGITYYDVEQVKNKKASHIVALNEKYSKQASLELKRLLNP